MRKLAIEKTLNSRIQLKHDLETNWNKAANFIPKQGEIIVYDIDENYDYERIKVGDGKTAILYLPFYLDSELDEIKEQINTLKNSMLDMEVDSNTAMLVFFKGLSI